ncbi:interleukin-7 receptor subunit alpha [Alligator mississippiensis]|uniref:interleukin-7 receptor subunit alpha n=1 Tax=Alligator mississippiensis TaxID=8496 RepID=UPI00287728F7|nr:interleukin-7 receptor subunit alpha [Alligator mississippiensis]
MLRMTRTSAAFSILLFLLHTASGESCCTSADGDGTFGDDELDNPEIDCFSQLEIVSSLHALICSFSEPSLNNTNFQIVSCISEERIEKCSQMKKQESTYSLEFSQILLPRRVCVILESKRKYCSSLKVISIVKPEKPFNVTITFQEAANEYLVQYKTPHSTKRYLSGKLIHQISYRWQKGSWSTIESQYLQIKLLGRNLEMGAVYELKVRSKPNGNFFNGTWSDWSTSEFFTTEMKPPLEKNSDMIMVTLCTVGFIFSVIVIVLILTFWKNRIKPLVWPNLPDHKKTLEQLCKKPKNQFDTSFNPESFGYVHIHKVDNIQAKTETECFLQPSTPPEADVPEKVKSGSELKSSPIGTGTCNLKLLFTYGGIWPSDALNGCSCPTLLPNGVGFSSAITYPEGSSSGKQWRNDDVRTHSSSAMDAMTQHRSGPLNMSIASQTQPNNEIRSSNKDEAYVTMSSFYKNQ